jgi:hypothetical protein
MTVSELRERGENIGLVGMVRGEEKQEICNRKRSDIRASYLRESAS